MTQNAMQRRPDATTIEQVLVGGNLAQLTTEQRVEYYNMVCASVGLNPLTRPFDYITLNNKLTLYAKRDCTDQLRKINTVSVQIVSRENIDGVYVVTARAVDKAGRQDESTGAVSIGGLKGEAAANAMMKAETKAKRRVTLSICGLGMLDETEVETVPGAARFREVVDEPARAPLAELPPGVTRGMPEREPVHLDPKPNIAREAMRKLVQGWCRINAREADRQVVKLAEAWGFSKDNPPQSSDWESMWNYAETAHQENDTLGFIDYVEQVRAQMAAQLQPASVGARVTAEESEAEARGPEHLE